MKGGFLKVLVTGGAGFIGSHIADGLIQEGHQVAVIDNLITGRLDNVHPKVRFYLLDIRSQEVEKVFEHEKFDVVCHHAAQMDVRRSVEDPGFDAGVNIIGSINLLQNCVRFKVRRFIFASTGGAIYGEQKVFPCDETHPTQPVSPYGISKLTVEKYLYFYAIAYGLGHVILRYSNVYGPRQNPHGEAGVVAIFTKKLLAGKQPVINGDGRQTRDFVFVKDVVRANLQALEFRTNDIFNIGTSHETDVNTLFQMLLQKTNSRAAEKHGQAMPGEQMRSVIDFRKAKEILHWVPAVPIEEGIEQTVQYFRAFKES